MIVAGRPGEYSRRHERSPVAVYEDLLDAIARVRAGTGDADAWMRGLSGPDLAVAANLVAVRTGAIDTVLAKIRGGHPELFDPPPAAPATPGGEPQPEARTGFGGRSDQNRGNRFGASELDDGAGRSAGHHRGAQRARERRRCRAVLDGLQRDVEAAVAGRTDLDTPAGARGFQRYLIDKLRDIRTVVETAGLDATSKAALVAALASLYATPCPRRGSVRRRGQNPRPSRRTLRRQRPIPRTKPSSTTCSADAELDLGPRR